MCSKLQTIVCSYCLYPSFKRHEQLLHSLSQLLGILTMLQLPHEQHVCLFFDQSHNGSTIAFSYDGVHLKVAKADSVNLLWSLADAYTIRYDYPLAPNRPCTMLQPLPQGGFGNNYPREQGQHPRHPLHPRDERHCEDIGRRNISPSEVKTEE